LPRPKARSAPRPTLPDENSLVQAPAIDLAFKLEMEILPEIQLPDMSKFGLVRAKAEVSDETLDTQMGEMAKRLSGLADFTDEEKAARADGAIAGDVLTVDFVGKIGEEEFAGGKMENADVEIGGSDFIPGFAEQLAGAKAGEERTITVTFPADYRATELAGKEATFAVTVKQHRKREAATLDDAFAQRLGLESIDELRDTFKSRTQANYDQMARMYLKRQVLDALAVGADFPAPDGLVDMEFDKIWAQFEANRKDGQVEPDEVGKDDDTLKADYRNLALRRVRLGLIVREIARVNDLTASQDDITRALRTEAMRYPGQEQQIIDFFRQNPSMIEGLVGPIVEDKVTDFVVELAQVTEKTVTPDELSAEPPAPTVGEAAPEAPAAEAT